MADKDHSIIQRLKSEGRRVPDVDLKEAEGEADLSVVELSLRESGRFQVLGELATGGVGQVLKGRDRDLGRDVALKVILEQHIGNEEILKRFIEEAQIGGQLQHPGIVPVYELGLQADQRPFFAMKLVKGRTLAAMLTDREDPAEDRQRFLQIFEEICQTVGYAHSRGVIHRDLKPTNVMVGAFGEVQVLDWGFAKVLPRGGIADERASRIKTPPVTEIATVRSLGDGSESIPGSVMGTLAYMPPEQALGQVDELTEQSDVFSLGAILLEILTGEPPYTGKGMDRLIQAAQCQITEAYARLEACDADVTLVDLTKLCLSPLSQDRPRNAAAVAEVVHGHLAKAEERARQSTIEATRFRAEAKRAVHEARDQRRVRRLGLALAASVFLLLLAAGGSYAFVARSQQTRAEWARSAVTTAMTKAQRLRGEGRYAESLRRAKQAEEFAQVEAVDSETRMRASTLLAAVSEEEAAARTALLQEARDAALLAELEEIRLQTYEDAAAAKSMIGNCIQAFRAYGIDLETVDSSTAGERIRARGEDFAIAVVGVLDVWFWNLCRNPELPGPGKARVESIADACDPDRRQNRLRSLIKAKDGDGLVALAGEEETLALPAANLIHLAGALQRKGRTSKALLLLEEATRRHPEDPWVHLMLGRRHQEAHRYQDALRHYTALVAVLPETASAYNPLGALLRVRARITTQDGER